MQNVGYEFQYPFIKLCLRLNLFMLFLDKFRAPDNFIIDLL